MGSARTGSNPVGVVLNLTRRGTRNVLQGYNSVVEVLGNATAWPSGLRRQLKALVRKGVGSNPTAVIFLFLCRQQRYPRPASKTLWCRSWGFGAVGSA